jgi:zinc transporter
MLADPVLAANPDTGFGIVPGLVWAFRFNDDGTAVALDIDQPIEKSRSGWLWLHINLTDARSPRWLAGEFPGPALELLTSRRAHQQLHASDDCVYGILSDVVRSVDKQADELAHLHFMMTENILVSGRHHSLSAVEMARQEISGGVKRLPTVAALLELLVERVVDAMSEYADTIAKEIDGIEESLITRKVRDERQRLAKLRHNSSKIHRQLAGLRSIFHRLEREGVERLKPTLRVAASRLAQRLDALDHDIVELRDRAHLLQEEVGAKMTEQTNGHLHVLSILTMLFMPPTLVTGVFGMNTKGLPFTDNESAFLLAMGLLLASSLAVYLVMRRLGIFKL